jgi:hypothetical protein
MVCRKLRPHFKIRNGVFVSFTLLEKSGHQHSKTTEIYTHVSRKNIGKIKGPLDSLNINKKGGDDQVG